MLRRITLHQLRLFAALARSMNMTRAAEELHMTPSAFSIQIKQLSESFGAALHEQVGKKLFLTEAGRTVAAAARDMIERLDLLGMEIAEQQGLTRGALRVAMITTARYFATRMIGDFCRAYPNIEFVLEVVNRDQILQRMRDNLDDLYIMGQVPEELDVVALPVAENPLVVIAPANHPLCGETAIAPRRLAQEPFILREAGSGTRQAIERYFARHGVTPSVRMSLGSDETIKQVVAAGLGVTALSRHVLALDAASGQLRELDVQGFPIQRQWYLAHLAAKKLSPPARAFVELLTGQARGRAS
ncbi:transcriptional regulator, LysR family [Rhodoblastus acidophilus]|uniref:HTH-type transcriptional regulator CbbR n=1 Tax=Rhodoblastus acidophilus TaxID=1074 RepID=A0A212Q4M1_RHOAC|nr:LysR family transcriptional regulator [Rhodoblastus acidophilus]PPQ37180.1 LysR family transcriptional regulator [Rhodoblastus acidophilus]RAI16640.1 LysR family transcriptional regulator [Rhodoblastus acidophilus]SNB54154.1 transcriptional regulator, LysR family [Rhodoblastus acidophilus]